MTGIARDGIVHVAAYLVVPLVHLRLIVRVADQAGKHVEVIRIGVARLARGPFAFVSVCKDGEEIGIVVEIHIGPNILRMAIDTGGRIALPAVYLLVIGLVAGETVVLIRRVEQRIEIWWWAVARGAIQRLMNPDEREATRQREVIYLGTFPGIRRMAFEAVRRETATRMLLIIRRLVACMAIVLIDRIEQSIEIWRRTVTRGARQRIVRANECEAIRKREMVYRPPRPLLCSVARQAGCRVTVSGVLLLIV